jgi:ribosomal subunit interface protein
MDVTITARHCAIPPTTRARATDRLRRLARYEPRLSAAQLRYERDHGEHHIETLLAVPGRGALVAHGSGESFRSALDSAVGRLERQLLRRRARARRQRAAPPVTSAAPGAL